MDEQRFLLDQLMGKTRNLPDALKGSVREAALTDREVCKYFIAGLCPHNLFSATKSDLGKCPNEICGEENSEAVRLRHCFECLSHVEKNSYGFEFELMHFLGGLVRSCDQKIQKNKRRAEKEMAISEESLAKIAEIETQIREVTEKCVSAAEEGDIDLSQQYSNEIDGLKEQIDNIANPKDIKATTVCEISGNFMSTRDNDERMRAHFEGKQYLGWKAVREKYAELSSRNLQPPVKDGKRPTDGGKHPTGHSRPDRDVSDGRKPDVGPGSRTDKEKGSGREAGWDRREHRERRNSRERERDVRDNRERRDSRERSGERYDPSRERPPPGHPNAHNMADRDRHRNEDDRRFAPLREPVRDGDDPGGRRWERRSPPDWDRDRDRDDGRGSMGELVAEPGRPPARFHQPHQPHVYVDNGPGYRDPHSDHSEYPPPYSLRRSRSRGRSGERHPGKRHRAAAAFGPDDFDRRDGDGSPREVAIVEAHGSREAPAARQTSFRPQYAQTTASTAAAAASAGKRVAVAELEEGEELE